MTVAISVVVIAFTFFGFVLGWWAQEHNSRKWRILGMQAFGSHLLDALQRRRTFDSCLTPSELRNAVRASWVEASRGLQMPSPDFQPKEEKTT